MKTPSSTRICSLNSALRGAGVALSLLAAVSLSSGCSSLAGDTLGSSPGVDLGPDPLGPLFVLPSLMDEDRLPVVLEVDRDEYQVGDEFYWYAKFENNTLKDATVRVFADATGDLLRVDQTGGISDPLLGSNILRVRAGARYTHGVPSGGLRGEHVLAPQQVEIVEGRGQLVAGQAGQILIRFPDMEIVLPGPGTYDIYMPVRVDWFRKYAVGRRFNIREETRSNIETITVR